MWMAEIDLAAIVKAEIDDAVVFCDEIGADRAKSTRYYRGDKLGNEQEGRSQVVDRVVRDAVQQILPSCMRVFLGTDKIVEYEPEGPEDVAQAEQATDYVNLIILRDNPGYLEFHSVFKDALYHKFGVMKYWWDESVDVTYHNFTGLSDEALGALLSEDGVEIVTIESEPIPEAIQAAMAQGMQPPSLHDVQVRRVRKRGRERIAAVPGEEFLIDRAAKDIDSARFVAHRTLKSISDLAALGYDPEMLADYGSASALFGNAEAEARTGRSSWVESTPNESERRIQYCECYIRADTDNDGIAELLKVCTLGDGYDVVDAEPVPERPFAAFRVDPEPHAFVGEDVADWVKDLQVINSELYRRMLESLAISINPSAAVVEGMVNMDDAQSTAPGRIIRQRAPGMYQPFTQDFVGREAIPVLGLTKDLQASRTGTVNMALQADALQSTTSSAVNAQVDSARQRLELIIRTLAETGMVRLFQGLLRDVCRHQDKARMVRLRNEWVEINPATWNANMDVTVNVGLGQGLATEKAAVLREVMMLQKEALTMLGPNNPWVTLGHVSHTVGKLLNTIGEKDAGKYFNSLPPDFQMPEPPPKPTPEEIFAQTEAQKTQAKMADDQQTAALNAAKLELERDKALADIFLRARQQNIDMADLQASLDQDRLTRAP